MKTIVFLMLITVFSCSKEPLDKSPYHQFDTHDRSYLFEINGNEDNVIQFENQDGGMLVYALVLNTIQKFDYSIGSFWGSNSSTLYFYDQQTLEFESLNNSNDLTALKLIVFKNSNNELEGGFYFHRWTDNECICPTSLKYYSVNNASISSMTVGDIVYEKVITVNSESNLDSVQKNVNRLYIDLNKGLIGFDDLNNREWRLVESK